MNISTQEQANAVYMLRKQRQMELSNNIRRLDSFNDMAELKRDFAALEVLFNEGKRLQELAIKERGNK